MPIEAVIGPVSGATLLFAAVSGEPGCRFHVVAPSVTASTVRAASIARFATGGFIAPELCRRFRS